MTCVMLCAMDERDITVHRQAHFHQPVTAHRLFISSVTLSLNHTIFFFLNHFLLLTFLIAEALDKWFDELQLYEKNLEDMASASFDPNFKEELHHVDQWYRALTEAERTAAIYSLLQHSSQVQLRFFSTVLQQMNAQDPVSALLSPAHPEKGKSAC